MNRTGLLATAVVVLASCQSDTRDASVKTFTDDALSLAPPTGWEAKRQK